MHYSESQRRYITVFMQHIRIGLAQGNQNNSWISAALGTASQGVGYASSGMQIIQTLSTTVGIAGIIVAPATLGISIGAAGTIIGVAQGGYQFYQMARKALGEEETTFISDEVLRESATLAFEILFEEVAVSLAIQYRFFIETKATNAGIDSLAIFAVKEVMQQWIKLTEEKDPLKKVAISPMSLIAPLFKSSQTRMESFIAIKSQASIRDRHYATGVYPLAAVARLEMNATSARWVIYERDKTKFNYGYRTCLTIPPKHALSSFSPDWPSISPHLSAEFLIDATTITVVNAYLVKKRTIPSSESLNDYLSSLYGVNLIATCHDNSLQQIHDLSEGDFSYVNFRRADLRGCILANTRWDNAYLTHAFFGNPKDPVSSILPTPLQLHGTQFNGAHLEASFWENTDFSGALFLSAHMKGATLIYCQLGTLQHAGCEWDLAQWQDMQAPDSIFLEQLEAEQIARFELEKSVDELSKSLSSQTQQLMKVAQKTEINDSELSRLKRELLAQQSNLSRLYAHIDNNLSLIETRLTDMNTQICKFLEILKACQTIQSSDRCQIIQIQINESLENDEARRAENQAFQQSIQTTIDNMQKGYEEKFERLESQIKAIIAPGWPTAEGIPEFIPRPLYAIYGAYLSAFKNPLLQQTLEYYVEPDSRPFQSADAHFPLSSELIAFEQDNDADIYLLHGDVGAGKSSAARLSQKRLWDAWTQDTAHLKPLVPVLIELKQISDDRDFLTARLQAAPYYYTFSQIQTLRENYHFFFILDGWDECPKPDTRWIPNDIQLPFWNAKLLITVRTEWLNKVKAMDSREMLKSNALTSKTYHVTESYISPYDQEHIDSYLTKRFAMSEISWKRYRDFLQQQEALTRMATSPVMLHILCAILPELMSQHQNTTIYTRVGLYETFLNRWFEREINKEQMLKTAPSVTSKQLKQEFLEYTQILAFTMFREATLVIERRYHEPSRMKKALGLFGTEPEKKDPWIVFFESQDPIVLQAQRSCPLSLERIDKDENHYHRYQFIHKSFMEHAVATVLWDVLNDEEFDIQNCTAVWNHRFITEERGVLNFLLDRLTASPRRPQLEEYLLEIVLNSKNNSAISKAASSAITVLNLSDFDFSKQVPNQDFTDICIPHADLTECRWMDLDCSRMDATDVNFHNAVLLGTKFCKSTLTNARFLAGKLFVSSEHEVEVMLLHPKRAGIAVYGDNNDIIIVCLASGIIEQRLIGHTDKVTSLAFSQKGVLASGSKDHTVRLWNHEGIFESCLIGHTKAVTSLAFSQNGMLASGSDDTNICYWHPNRSILLKVFKGHTDAVTSLSFGPNDVLASASGERLDNTIRLWDLREPAKDACIKILFEWSDRSERRPFSSVKTLAFAPDGTLVSGHEYWIHFWDIHKTDSCIKIITWPRGTVTSLIFLPNGTLASNLGNAICLWDLKREPLKAHLKTLEGHTDGVTSLALGLDGMLVSGSRDKTIRLWDIQRTIKNEFTKTIKAHDHLVEQIAFSPNGMIATSSRNTIYLWDPEKPTKNACVKILKSFFGHSRTISALAFAPDGILASGDEGGTICLWDLQKSAEDACIKSLKVENFISSLIFISDRILATGGGLRDKTIRLWDIKLPTIELQIPPCEDYSEVNLGQMTGLDLGLFGTVSIQSLRQFAQMSSRFGDPEQSATEAHVKNLDGHTQGMLKFALSSDGILASGSGDKSIRLWDIHGTCFKTLDGHTDWISSLAFSPSGILATGGGFKDKTIRLWDPKLPTSEAYLKTLEGCTGNVESLAFTPDGQWLIAESNKELLIWNTHNLEKEPHCFPPGISHVRLQGNLLSFAHDKAVYAVRLTEFPRTFHWVMASQPSTLWLHGCDVTNAQGILLPIQQLLEKEGALGKPAKFDSIELNVLDVSIDKIELPLLPPDFTNISTSSPEAYSLLSTSNKKKNPANPQVLSHYPGRLLNQEPVLDEHISGEGKTIDPEQKKGKCIIS